MRRSKERFRHLCDCGAHHAGVKGFSDLTANITGKLDSIKSRTLMYLQYTITLKSQGKYHPRTTLVDQWGRT